MVVRINEFIDQSMFAWLLTRFCKQKEKEGMYKLSEKLDAPS